MQRSKASAQMGPGSLFFGFQLFTCLFQMHFFLLVGFRCVGHVSLEKCLIEIVTKEMFLFILCRLAWLDFCYCPLPRCFYVIYALHVC